MRHIQRAFTIVELMVVVGVITLLMSIILPVTNRSIEQARLAKCESNQHQIYTALKAFAQDHYETLPGSCGGVAPGGPGSTPYYGVGQLVSCSDSLPQSTLEQSARSVLVVRNYLPNSAIFHCPQQELNAGIQLGYTQCSATFHYVFNQYFVGDLPCAPNGISSTNNFQPVYSSAFPDVTAPITLNRASQITSRCVLITEDGMLCPNGLVQDSTQEYDTLLKVSYLHANPWHAVRQHKSTDAQPYIIADIAVCTYVDGHTELVYVKVMDGAHNYVVPSDIIGLPR